MIEVTDLSKKYDSFFAVRDITFKIAQGEIVGLLGPNGAGKTTIMKILTGFHYPNSGQVLINGIDLNLEPIEVKRLIGYLPENSPVYPELNVGEFLEFIATTRLGKRRSASGLNPHEAINFAIERCGLQNVTNKGIHILSKGYRQRLGVAQAILHDPDILILDEPSNGLDPNQILEIRHLILELGRTKTILLSTHILQEVEATCSKVLILNKGTIAARGTTSEIGNTLRSTWQCNIVITGHIADFISKFTQQPGFKYSTDKVGHYHLSCPRMHLPSLTSFQEYIFDTACSTGCKLLESRPEVSSLEEIFVSLTKSMDPNNG